VSVRCLLVILRMILFYDAIVVVRCSGESVDLLSELLQLVRSMRFLNGPWLMFNAFIFALLK